MLKNFNSFYLDMGYRISYICIVGTVNAPQIAGEKIPHISFMTVIFTPETDGKTTEKCDFIVFDFSGENIRLMVKGQVIKTVSVKNVWQIKP